MEKVVALSIYFICMSVVSGFAQTSAQASMEVSVSVVRPVSVDFTQTQLLSVAGGPIGAIRLRGTGDRFVMISIPRQVTVYSREGSEAHYKISDHKIHQSGTPIATIEYL